MSPEFDALEVARIVEALHSAATPSRTAQEIMAQLCGQVDAHHAGVMLIRGRRLVTMAATDSLVARADALQNELDEGPCWDSSWRGETLTVSDLATDRRWPRWAAEVAGWGVASVLAVELASVEDRRLGSINVYWDEPRTFTADDIAFSNLFARHAALALAQSMNEARLSVELDGRKLIGQAQGILMERYGLDEARAFEALRRYSRDHDMKLRQVAEYLVSTRGRRSSPD